MSPQDNSRRLLLDIPENDPIFGFDRYASTLTSVIRETDPHFTIGIFGKWGSGKTTLLKNIENLITSSYSDIILPVFFDAWRYQREEHMLLPILDTISEHLRSEETHWQQLKNKLKMLTSSMASAMTLKLPFLECDVGGAIEQYRPNENLKSDYYNWLSKLQQSLDEVRHEDPSRRIVVIIDDLDRCLPHKVIEVLESIKVMLDISGFVFVLALDESIVEQAIKDYYGPNYGIPSKDYIKKLIQVEFRLPPLRKQDVIAYTQVLQQKIGHVDAQVSTALAQVVPIAVEDNPREVKRFINKVLLTTMIMKGMGITLPTKHQIAFIAMDFRWPGIVRGLANEESLRKYIKEHIEAKVEGRGSSLSDKETKSIVEMFENNPGLDSYLEQIPGKELLDLDEDTFNELIYYTSLTREKRKPEVAEDLIDEVLSTLTPREQRVLQLRFGLEDGRSRTLEEVGREFALTRERIRQNTSTALRKLRHPSRSRRLRSLLSSIDEMDSAYQNLLLAIFGPEWQKNKSLE